MIKMNEKVFNEIFPYGGKWFGKEVTKREALDLCVKEVEFYSCTYKGEISKKSDYYKDTNIPYEMSDIEYSYFKERSKFYSKQFYKVSDTDDDLRCFNYRYKLYGNKSVSQKTLRIDSERCYTLYYDDDTNDVIAKKIKEPDYRNEKYYVNKKYVTILEELMTKRTDTQNNNRYEKINTQEDNRSYYNTEPQIDWRAKCEELREIYKTNSEFL
jgi:hypothetical protein